MYWELINDITGTTSVVGLLALIIRLLIQSKGIVDLISEGLSVILKIKSLGKSKDSEKKEASLINELTKIKKAYKANIFAVLDIQNGKIITVLDWSKKHIATEIFEGLDTELIKPAFAELVINKGLKIERVFTITEDLYLKRILQEKFIISAYAIPFYNKKDVLHAVLIIAFQKETIIKQDKLNEIFVKINALNYNFPDY